MYGRRILILAPHPDDEIVGCAAAMTRARAIGCDVAVLFLTTGVPARDTLWPWDRHRHGAHVSKRRAEAERAADEGGYMVLGFLEIASRQLRHHFADTRAHVIAISRSYGADRIWVPAFEGGHQDHDAANALAATLPDGPEVWEFAEYNYADARVHSQTFPSARHGETVIKLTEAERAGKRRLLQVYGSEAGNLGHIGLDQECFRPLARHDYGRPPHPGTLFYARFQWVPFRHPRVDFTDPSMLYAELLDLHDHACEAAIDDERIEHETGTDGHHSDLQRSPERRAAGR